MQGQRLLLAFRQTLHGRLVAALQLRLQAMQGGGRLRIRWALIGPVQPGPPSGLFACRSVLHHILPFVPLAPLDHGRGAKGLPHGGAQAFGPINDDQEAVRTVEAPVT